MLKAAALLCSAMTRRAPVLHHSVRSVFPAGFREALHDGATARRLHSRASLCDDIERLSHGLATRNRIGSRNTPHRLNQRERALFEAAKRKRFLQIPASGARENLISIYRLWCESTGCSCDVRYTLHRNFSTSVRIAWQQHLPCSTALLAGPHTDKY